MAQLARWCVRHRFIVLALWAATFLGLTVAAKQAGKAYDEGFALPGTASTHAQQLLATAADRSPSGDDTIVVHTLDSTLVTDPAVQQEVTAALQRASTLPLTASIRPPYSTGGAGQISPDRRTAYAVVSFTKPDQSLTRSDISPLVDTLTRLRGPDLQVEFGGGGFQTLKGSPLSGTVGIGLGAAAIVLFLAFGSLLATLIPLVAAIIAVGAGIETIGLLSHVLSINSFTPSVAALIGIGVAVDYALFVVSRHRSGLRAGLSPEQAAARAVNTSGRAVVFAGATVAVAMLGLTLLGVTFLTGVGIAAAITVALAVAAAITLLPALFGVLGLRILGRRDRRRLVGGSITGSESTGRWAAWARTVHRRSLLLSIGALAVMVALVVPSFAIRLGSSDQGNDPAGSTTRKAYDLIADGFGAGHNGPLLVVAQTSDPTAQAAFGRLAGAVRAAPGVASVVQSPPSPSGGVSVLDVIPTTSPQSSATQSLITRLRSDLVPAAERGTSLRAFVGGQTAVFEDFADVLSSKLPLFLGVVVLFGFLLLLLAFRSLLVPLTAAVMNLLAAGAAFGAVVAVFQWGWGSESIGLGPAGPIESFLPVMLIAILFGLSMDYQVFLVSRIHEEWIQTRDNQHAVRAGQAHTGRVITAAAAIMVFVFLAFVLEGRRPIGEFGLGLAAAILLDALLLRTVLVPAAMHLFGAWNWWLPPWLDRLLPHLSVDPSSQSPQPPTDISAGPGTRDG